MILAAEYVPSMYATVWALVPPVVAIVLALITKEVYSSLFVGIVIGGLFYGNAFQPGFSAERSVLHIFEDGLVGVLSDSYNVGILIFLVVLGVMVSMMNKAGGSAAFGEWASEHIKTRIGAQLSAIILGVLIFIDDYFNCLTVGSVMRPVTDKHQVSRAKLAYLIDATAAPVCIIAPISSWAAAVTGFVKGEDGFSIFIKAIPYNYYALFTIIAMVTLVVLQVDFGPMAKHEANAQKGDLFTTGDRPYAEAKQDVIKGKGKVIDLVFPILILIISCIIGMIYTGGFFDGTGFVDAFAGSDASIGLMLGSFFALIITICFYSIRRVLSFTDCCNSIPEGFKAMVPANTYTDLCMDTKDHDREPWRQGICRRLSGRSIGTTAWTVPGNHIPGGSLPCLCNRNLMGHLRYTHTDSSKYLLGHKPYDDDYLNLSVHGRCSMRRPLLTDIRYHHHGIGRSSVQPHESCVHTASVRCACGRHIMPDLHHSRFCQKSGSTVYNRSAYPDWNLCRNQVYHENR